MGRTKLESNESVNVKDYATREQIHTLLDVAGMLHSVLAGAITTDPDTPAKIDGGARVAAENSFVNVCNRIDAILTNEARWDVGGYDELLQNGLVLQQQNLQLMRAQTAAVEELNTPHGRLKPSLFRLQAGGWAAIVGNENHLEHALVGTGATPEEAIIAFDLIFKGQLPPTTIAWLTHREEQVAKGEKPNDVFPKYETNTMDQTGTKRPNKTKSRRKDAPRDSDSTGPNDQVGGS